MLPRKIEIELLPQFVPWCERGTEEACLIHFGVWRWARRQDIHISHLKVYIDGSVRFNHAGVTYSWPPNREFAQMALEFDRTGKWDESRVITLDTGHALTTDLKARDPRTHARPHVWVIEGDLFRRLRRDEDAGLLETFTGTQAELRKERPGLRPERSGGRESPRRARFHRLLDDEANPVSLIRLLNASRRLLGLSAAKTSKDQNPADTLSIAGAASFAPARSN
jgi:hypothetical protein